MLWCCCHAGLDARFVLWLGLGGEVPAPALLPPPLCASSRKWHKDSSTGDCLWTDFIPSCLANNSEIFKKKQKQAFRICREAPQNARINMSEVGGCWFLSFWNHIEIFSGNSNQTRTLLLTNTAALTINTWKMLLQPQHVAKGQKMPNFQFPGTVLMLSWYGHTGQWVRARTYSKSGTIPNFNVPHPSLCQ